MKAVKIKVNKIKKNKCAKNDFLDLIKYWEIKIITNTGIPDILESQQSIKPKMQMLENNSVLIIWLEIKVVWKKSKEPINNWIPKKWNE